MTDVRREIKVTPGSVRVARIITRLNIGGPSVQAIDLCRELAFRGIETCLIYGCLADGEGDITQWLPISATKTVYVNNLIRRISPIRDIQAFWQIYRALLRWRPHIVHTHMAKAGTVGRLAALAYNLTARGVPRASIVHTYHGHVFEGYFPFSIARLFMIIERALARCTDVLIAISPQVRTDLIGKYRIARQEQLRLIPLGFNLDRLIALSSADRQRARETLQIPRETTVVATVGRLTAVKNHGHFLEMASQLAHGPQRYLFLITGDGERRTKLETQAERLGINMQVRFLGWRSDLDTIYGASDIFVLTSRNEGTPVALIEAMAAGLAVVSTDVGGVCDIVNTSEAGVLVPFGDVEALTMAVRSLAADHDRRRQIGARARASVQQRFDGKRLTNEVRNLYRELLHADSRIAAHSDTQS